MITLSVVKKAVVDVLKTTGHHINSRDIKEGFKRPSFFVQLENNIRSGTPDQIHRFVTIHIYYFPDDRYNVAMDLLKMEDQMEELFDLKLKVKDRYLNINELNSFVNDDVLNVSFDLEFEIARRKNIYDPDNVEFMEELDQRLITKDVKINGFTKD